MKYYLVGYMYSGKSTFGRQLAASKGMDFLDLDRAFEQRYHYTVPRFFAAFGGTPCHSSNMDFILAHGTAIYLRMSVDDLVSRALRSRNPRPLVKGLSESDLRARIDSQLKEREPSYLRAPIILDGLNPIL